ncbi:MAG: metal ABC transporter substrate-binding protein [Dermatophilaceae bacterium]
MPPRPLPLAVAAALALSLLACTSPRAPEEAAAAASGRIPVVAGFYPLSYAVQRIGGDRVIAIDLTKPGAEPHDAELTPSDLAVLAKARLVVYLRGFQPAVDDAVDQRPSAWGPSAEPLEVRAAVPAVGSDPHFWLDPTAYAALVAVLAQRLGALDPAHASDYATDAAAFTTELNALDADFRTGLATCRSRELVTAHEAFGHLADRYGLTQVGIAGLSPDHEPSSAKLAEIATLVKERGVRTIYTEPLVDPRVAQTLAASTGVQVAVLDPVEGITGASAGAAYPAVMRANLAALRSGQECA